MSTPNRTPTFNLKIVVHETGLTPDALRAWEKRYGLPQPDRTAGGHRLYSQYDIDMLKWLVARKEEGLSISRAVKLWKQLEAEGQEPLQISSAYQSDIPSPTRQAPVGNAIVEARQAWVTACLAFDEQRAERALSEAFALHSPEVVCVEVLQKGLADIGERWYQNQVSVQQEHFASALAIRRLQALVAAAPNPTRSGAILVGCPPNEEHSFSPLLLTLLLRRQSWPVTYLGANVPLLKLEETLSTIKPQLVIMAAQHLYTAATLLGLANFLRQKQMPLAFGGRVFNYLPALRARIPGHFLGDDLGQAGQAVEHLMTTSPSLPNFEPISPQYEQALSHYQGHQALIESHIWQAVADLNIAPDQLANANREMAKTIIAALILGDINFAGPSISWVESLLHNYNFSNGQLHHYLTLYHQAARANLDQAQGQPVLAWLEKFTEGPG